jgi:queuine tRNA-ribosyltransferase
MLLSLVNLFYYQDLMRGAREAIAAGSYDDFRSTTRAGWARGDIAPDVAPM